MKYNYNNYNNSQFMKCISVIDDFPYRLVEPDGGYMIREGDQNLSISINRTCSTSCSEPGYVGMFLFMLLHPHHDCALGLHAKVGCRIHIKSF